MPPFLDLAAYSKKFVSETAANGNKIFRSVQLLVRRIATISEAGNAPDQMSFRKALGNLDMGESTEDEYQYSMKRQKSIVQNLVCFESALQVFPTKVIRDGHNQSTLKTERPPCGARGHET